MASLPWSCGPCRRGVAQATPARRVPGVDGIVEARLRRRKATPGGTRTSPWGTESAAPPEHLAVCRTSGLGSQTWCSHASDRTESSPSAVATASTSCGRRPAARTPTAPVACLRRPPFLPKREGSASVPSVVWGSVGVHVEKKGCRHPNPLQHPACHAAESHDYGHRPSWGAPAADGRDPNPRTGARGSVARAVTSRQRREASARPPSGEWAVVGGARTRAVGGWGGGHGRTASRAPTCAARIHRQWTGCSNHLFEVSPQSQFADHTLLRNHSHGVLHEQKNERLYSSIIHFVVRTDKSLYSSRKFCVSVGDRAVDTRIQAPPSPIVVPRSWDGAGSVKDSAGLHWRHERPSHEAHLCLSLGYDWAP